MLNQKWMKVDVWKLNCVAKADKVNTRNARIKGLCGVDVTGGILPYESTCHVWIRVPSCPPRWHSGMPSKRQPRHALHVAHCKLTCNCKRHGKYLREMELVSLEATQPVKTLMVISKTQIDYRIGLRAEERWLLLSGPLAVKRKTRVCMQ